MYLFAEVGQENLVGALLDFQSNFINWLILVAVIFFLVRKFLPPVISQRQASINSELAAATETRKNAEKALAEQKERVEQASQAIEKIVVEAQQTAKQMVEEMHKQTEQSKVDLLKKFEVAAQNERQVAVIEMRTIVAKAAIKLTEENLSTVLTENNKVKIGQEFMGELSRINQANFGGESFKKNNSNNHDLASSGADMPNNAFSNNDKNLVDS